MKIELYSSERELQEIIEIYKTSSKFSGWDYTIYNRRTNVDGSVEIRLRNLNWFEERNNPATDYLIGIIDYENEQIAEIQKFYPHGDKPDNKVLRKGIGTTVLRSVLGELDNLKYFYSFSNQYKYCKLLLKEGFKELKADDSEKHLLKVSNQPFL